jgi:hypothetical protein
MGCAGSLCLYFAIATSKKNEWLPKKNKPPHFNLKTKPPLRNGAEKVAFNASRDNIAWRGHPRDHVLGI